MDTSKNKEILDAEILNEELNNESVEVQDSPETKTIFKILIKDSGTENMAAVFDYVDAHSFNSEIIVGIIHLILNSYCSMVPEEERASFAIDVIQKFIQSLDGKQEDQESDDFIPDQPEHDGN